jgi:hypothetical protein
LPSKPRTGISTPIPSPFVVISSERIDEGPLLAVAVAVAVAVVVAVAVAVVVAVSSHHERSEGSLFVSSLRLFNYSPPRTPTHHAKPILVIPLELATLAAA